MKEDIETNKLIKLPVPPASEAENVITIPVEGKPEALPLPPDGACRHGPEKVHVNMHLEYVADINRYTLELDAHCQACNEAFVFDGLPVGILFTKPCASAFGNQATLPIRPGGFQHAERSDERKR